MARKYHSTEVFKPNAYPDLTYINRSIDGKETYEQKLRKALRTPGLLTLITGSSKSGKTVLYHSVIPTNQLVEIMGSHIQTQDDFWSQIAEKLHIPTETEITKSHGNELGGSGELSGSIPFVATGKGSVQVRHLENDTFKEKRLRSNNYIIDSLIQGNKVLVIDDFHYINPEIQLYIARVLKSELFYGLKVVLVSLPHRSDDAIRMNSDLAGRIRNIEIEPWSNPELQQIPKLGFSILDVTITNELTDLLVSESITSPQLMQQNCLNLAFELNIDENPLINKIKKTEFVHNAFSETIQDLNFYDSVVTKWLEGPTKGRDKRSKYKMRNGNEVDIYHLLLFSLAKDPPIVALTVTDLQNGITDILDQVVKCPNALTISNTISNIQKVLNENGELYKVLDWRDQKLHILDPFFLFYIRWKKWC